MADAGAKGWCRVMKNWCLASLLFVLATGVAFAQAPVIGQGGGPATGPPIVSRGNHAFTSGPTPTLGAGCGTAANGVFVTGNDVSGIVRLGSDYNPAGQCLIMFNQPWAWSTAHGMPLLSCTITFTKFGGSAAYTATWDNTSILFVGGTASDTTSPALLAWQCIGTEIP
jgi:hypothetical protein